MAAALIRGKTVAVIFEDLKRGNLKYEVSVEFG
jgi:hypothetical protein